ncbi:MAG: SDR family oxidoreductase [Acidobacteriota bacterium]|nr:SDR family oxidoreductase [Acidobacteriota bacterium]
MAKTALITGAITGIGYELAKLFAKDGNELVLLARDAGKLEQVAEEMRRISGKPVRVIAADLARPESAADIYRQFENTVVDSLVNNAGFGLGGPFVETDLQTELDMMQVNMVSLVHLTKLFARDMAGRKGGRILNVASTAAFQPGPLMAVYYASKSFVLSFSEALAEELRGSGVTVTTLCPGPTATEFQRRAKLDSARLFKGKTLTVMSAAKVAAIGYRGMMRGKVIVIPGVLNRMGVQSLRIAPRFIVRRAARKLQET